MRQKRFISRDKWERMRSRTSTSNASPMLDLHSFVPRDKRGVAPVLLRGIVEIRAAKLIAVYQVARAVSINGGDRRVER